MLPQLAAKMHDVHASLHDNTYKRPFGKWKEWEVVIWDDCLNMCKSLTSCICYAKQHEVGFTIAWIYCDSESADAFEQIWTAFFEVLEEVMGKPLQMHAFHGQGKYFAVLVDGDSGQALGLGKYLCKINEPKISNIYETDPAVLVQYILKTCWMHCSKWVSAQYSASKTVLTVNKKF